jgi:AbrB family looped-hinge helix DNA binding protein
LPSATLTSKGQVTIPKEVRDALGLHAGDRVAFVVRDQVVELRPETVDLRSLYGSLKHEGKPVTVEEMNRDIADAVVEARESARHAPKRHR